MERTTHSSKFTKLSLLLVAWSAVATTAQTQVSPASSGKAATDIAQVQRAACRSQFTYKNMVFSGCITTDSIGDAPWCYVTNPASANGNSFAFCVKSSIPPRSALDTTNQTAPCDESTPIDGGGAVFGCFTTQPQGGQLMCNAGASGPRPCIRAALTTESETTTKTSTTIFGIPLLAFAIGAGVIFLIILGTVVFCVMRRKNNKNKSSPGQLKDMHRYSEASQIGTPTASGFMSPAALPTSPQAAQSSAIRSLQQDSNVRPRVSSQYGPGGRMSMISVGDDNQDEEESLGKYVISATYTPTLDDEISINPGDIVEVFQEFDDGWCSAVNLSQGNSRGVFPMHCIDSSKGRLPN